MVGPIGVNCNVEGETPFLLWRGGGVEGEREGGREERREKVLGKRRWYKKAQDGVPIMAQWLTNPTRNHEVAGSIPGLRILCCRELWCRSQTRLGSLVAVALV